MIYDVLAGYYDQLVGDEEAVSCWTDWVESFHPGNTFLELACGTGEITSRLAENHMITALDLAPHMVEAARKKPGAEDIEYLVGDMRDLSGLPVYDAIGCFCDSFNYLLEKEEVQAFFETVSAHLKPGGLFFFDSHGMDRIEEFAGENAYEEAGQFEDGTGVQWQISSTPDGLIYQDFAFYLPDQTVTEHHMQRVYDPEWLSEQLSPNFEILSLTTDWETEGAGEGEKYFFVCRKKS